MLTNDSDQTNEDAAFKGQNCHNRLAAHLMKNLEIWSEVFFYWLAQKLSASV